MKALIINADDMGVSRAVNHAVIELYKASAISGVSLMAPGDAFFEACGALKDNGIREAGAHLTLTGKFRPAAGDRTGLKKVLTKQGYFPENYFYFALNLFSGKIPKQALRDELYLQIDKIKREGLNITHLDSHEHVHLMPGIIDIVLELCSEFAVPYLRVPIEDPFISRIKFKPKDLLRHKVLRFYSARALRKVRGTAVKSNSMFFGHVHSGRLTLEILSNIADRVSDGVTELAVHPAVYSPEFLKDFPWYNNGHIEKDALVSTIWKEKLKSLNIEIVPHSTAVAVSKKISVS